MNQNFLLLDACAYIQTAGRGFKCRENLQMNELRLFASSIGFLNGAASTHLSMNVIPSDIIDLLYTPGIVRGTFSYVNRLRMCIGEDNEYRTNKKPVKKGNPEKPAKKTGDGLEPTLSEVMEELTEALENFNWDLDLDSDKPKEEMRHPPLKTQIERIVAHSPRIQHLGIKWKHLRADPVTHKINDAFELLKDLAGLRSIHVGLAAFDFVRFVDHLPPSLEQLTLSTVFNSRYKSEVPVESIPSNLNATSGAKPARRVKAKKLPIAFKDPKTGASIVRPHFEQMLERVTAKLPRLGVLRLVDSNINGKLDFSALANHKSIHTIIISNSERFERQSFLPESLPATLRKFRLTDSEIRGHLDFSKFPASLTSLRLDSNEFKTHNKPSPLEFATLPLGLEELSLSRCIYLDIEFPLANCPPGLRRLNLGSTRAKGKINFATLPPGLEHLDLASLNGTKNSFLDLSECPLNLRSLSLRGTKFPGAGFRWSSLPPLLQYLNLSSCGITTAPKADLDLGLLPCAENIKVFNINYNAGIRGILKLAQSAAEDEKQSGNVVVGGSRRSMLPHLITLECGNCGFTAITATAKLPPNLDRLNVGFNSKLKDSKIFDFAFLNDKLKVIQAWDCSFTGCPDFSKLPAEFHSLRLDRNNLSTGSADIPLDLTKLPLHLHDLDISKNKFDGCGLLIANLGPRLKTLNLRKNNFNLKNSNLDTESALRLTQLHIDKLGWNDEKHQEKRANYLKAMKDSSDEDASTEDETSDDDEASSDGTSGEEDEEDPNDNTEESLRVGGDGKYYLDCDGDLDSNADLKSGFGADWEGSDQGYGDDETTDDAGRKDVDTNDTNEADEDESSSTSDPTEDWANPDDDNWNDIDDDEDDEKKEEDGGKKKSKEQEDDW